MNTRLCVVVLALSVAVVVVNPVVAQAQPFASQSAASSQSASGTRSSQAQASGQSSGQAAAQSQQDDLEGLWQGYDGEWGHVSRHVLALAEAIPAEKYSWRPAPNVRSASEVFMHIAMANFFLLSVTGPPMPSDMKQGMEKSITSKPEVISWLRRSFDAVKTAHANVKPADFQRKVTVFKHDATVDGMYLRIIVHANEHYGQMIAYARTMGVTPPWSKE